MTTGALILNLALLLAVGTLLTAVMTIVPNLDRIGDWRRSRRHRQMARPYRSTSRARVPHGEVSR